MENMNHSLETLNSIGPEWARQFEDKPQLDLSFQVNPSGMLTLNGSDVCPVTDVDFSSIYIDVESFGFFTDAGEEHRFLVDWPFEGKPQVTHSSRV